MATFPNPSALWFEGTWETPAGTINSINKVFALSRVPNPLTSVMLYLDDPTFATTGKGGIYQFQGTQYTISATGVITYTTAPTILAVHWAFYRYGGSGP